MLKSKIHRATVTHADQHYEGSISIDEELMEAADIIENEAVDVWNVTQGTRLTTYALPSPHGSGIICLNGAAALLNRPGDLVIIASFTEMEDAEARRHVPKVVLVGLENRISDKRYTETPGPMSKLMPT
ncbi:MAG TPA: aspartate 1-decarboxylase [Pyrinomonadaceae bacterium]|jgi:aspartate 1-decarboxylase|nr:aspartate 1-decarboxylase [Pyrinomonadaceae bacterium]